MSGTKHEPRKDCDKCDDGDTKQIGLVNVDDSFNDNEVNVLSDNNIVSVQVGADNVIA